MLEEYGLRKVDVSVIGASRCAGIGAEAVAKNPPVECVHSAKTHPEHLAEMRKVAERLPQPPSIPNS